ncbi:hypothetical protein [Arthrobacter sunyaminii]|uniref:Gram-positive cocci surface proteins LPxTG domain-containing protein n=1 Tax=Arthrobacter sunyaminii TaxID=2816859 RepID=A0A975S7G0_9MICC|nr:hypothetical protein [Arthrobacter sunyaminii]MBO0908203.1 hypothetical protein [Arthrobacter sunyaminii]QWQ37204.1 hypothetical protein KG104_05435 [Arthrobacter sunyaminii]
MQTVPDGTVQTVPDGTVQTAPDGTVQGPTGADPSAAAPGTAGPGSTSGACPTQTALADTGINRSVSSTGILVLGIGALLACAGALTLALRPRGSHG